MNPIIGYFLFIIITCIIGILILWIFYIIIISIIENKKVTKVIKNE